jgi:hypothetical protein
MGNPEKKGGLSPQDHGDLNRPSNVYPGGQEARDARLAELRDHYAGDPRARQQIDVYDSSTVYHDKLRKFTEALKSGDTARVAQLQAWFDEHYPDLK